MMSLNFYTIDQKYIKYLKSFDNKVPDIDYSSNKKFFCGVVLKINGHEYFAPITSFKKKQQTNLIIYSNSKNGKPISSIRFCHMIPVRKEYLTLKDISKISDPKYQSLVSAELQFCRANQEQIEKAAQRVYNYGITPQHFQYKNCCKFSDLERALNNYP